MTEPSSSGPSSDPTTSQAQRSRHPDDVAEIDGEDRAHEDLHRAAQASLERSAGPEGADPVDAMETESRDSEADGARGQAR